MIPEIEIITDRSQWAAVYVMCLGERATKIGVSRNPAGRARAIQVSQDANVNVYWAVWMNRPEAFRVERACKNEIRFSSNYIRGEWSRLSGPEALALIEKYILRFRIETRPCPQFGLAYIVDCGIKDMLAENERWNQENLRFLKPVPG